MNAAHSASVLALAFGSGLMLFTCGSCLQITRVPPGQSVAFSKAPIPEVVSTRTPERAEIVSNPEGENYYVGPAVEPELPEADFSLPEELADAETATSYATLGGNYLAEGTNSDAIEALEKAVIMEPNLSTAWRDLAIAYEKANEPEKAKSARERFKRHEGL